ncbi:MAG: radical SAM protein [Firmicutes bacterium]|nr:radical SAM protein [Bacillota bacterium]
MNFGDCMVKDLCFEIIESCPNECKFCSSNSCIDKRQIISFDDFKRVIDYFLKNGGIEELSLSGGEPFLHPELLKMVEYVKSLNIRTVIFTSGVKRTLSLNEEEIELYIEKMNRELDEIEKNEPWNERLKNNIKNYYENLINKPSFSPITKQELNILKSMGLDKIVFDCQAYEPETDEYLMGRNHQKHLCLLNSLLNASTVGLDTDAHFIPLKPNYKEIPDILEMLEIAGINNISILKFVPQGRGLRNIDKLMLSDNELMEFIKLLEDSRKIYSGNIRIGIPLMGDDKHKCNAGLEKLDIKFDGTVLPCPAFKELDAETMKKYGIKHYSIYENLEEVKTPGGKRVEPLCRKIYYK